MDADLEIEPTLLRLLLRELEKALPVTIPALLASPTLLLKSDINRFIRAVICDSIVLACITIPVLMPLPIAMDEAVTALEAIENALEIPRAAVIPAFDIPANVADIDCALDAICLALALAIARPAAVAIVAAANPVIDDNAGTSDAVRAMIATPRS